MQSELSFYLPEKFLPHLLCLSMILGLSVSTGFAQDFNTTFDHQALTVDDLDRSAEFYQEVLGLKEIPNKTGKPTRRWFSLGGDLELHLLEDGTEGIRVSKSIHLAVTISDFDAFVKHLRSSNIPFSDFPGNSNQINIRADGARQVFLQDPDGHWIEVNSTGTD